MTPPAPTSKRPTRLSRVAVSIIIGLLSLSFLSGAMVWWGTHQALGFDLAEGSSFSIRPWLVLHGALNPFLCGLFGWLCYGHVRGGWTMRANRRSGSVMISVFGALILTGSGLYYVGHESARVVLKEAHEWIGLLLPAVLLVHYLAARRWVKNL